MKLTRSLAEKSVEPFHLCMALSCLQWPPHSAEPGGVRPISRSPSAPFQQAPSRRGDHDPLRPRQSHCHSAATCPAGAAARALPALSGPCSPAGPATAGGYGWRSLVALRDLSRARPWAIARSEEKTSELPTISRTSFVVLCLKQKTHDSNSIEE